MKTTIFNYKQIKQAANLIKKGELVAFPTETVYGLGANALNSKAVKKIYKAKNRPADNPLIVHIHDKKWIYHLARKIPKKAEELINKFWPGPLTIILKKKKIIPNEVTCNLESVGIRMPNNNIALDLIKKSGVPIAAPSANLSGKPSGTCFKHVLDDFNGKIAGIIKSKDCKIGIESTVIDLTLNPPVLLRPSGISFEQLKKILPNIKLISNPKLNKLKSPGMKYTHYSPNAKIILFNKDSVNKMSYYKLKYGNKKIEVINPLKIKHFTKRLFKIFRQCDKNKVDYIFINSINGRGIGLAIMNRIKKAASEIV